MKGIKQFSLSSFPWWASFTHVLLEQIPTSNFKKNFKSQLCSVGLLNSAPWPWTGISSRGKPFSLPFFHHFKNTLTSSSTTQTWEGINFQWICMTRECATSGQGVDSLILVCQQRKSEHESQERRQINQIYTRRRNAGTPSFLLPSHLLGGTHHQVQESLFQGKEWGCVNRELLLGQTACFLKEMWWTSWLLVCSA